MQEYDKYENLHENLNSSTEESSGTDSGVDFRSTKKYGVAGVGTRNPEDRGHRGLGMGRTLHLPVDDIPPPLPEKDKLKSSRTKHLSHLPLVITAPSDPHSSRTKGRSRTTRSYSVSSTPPATLVKLLRAQESTTKETKVLLNAALSQLDAASARAAKAEAQFHARETSAILSHTQFTENVARLEEAAARARREAEAYKLQLRLRDEEVKKEKEKVRTEERMRAEAEKEAERARSLARRWREEGRVMKAKEDGRKEGFGEGLQRGRLVIAAAIAAKESSSDDRRLVGDGAAYIEEYEESEYPRRRAHSRSRASRSKRSEPRSAHRRERVNSSSKRHEPTPQYVPTFSALPPEPIQEPPPLIPESAAVIIRRARSIQTDPSLFQSERTRSLASSSSHSRQQQSGPSHVFVQESSPQPPVYNDRSPTPEEEETVKSESFSPEIPPTPQQLDPSPIPIPIPPPISQVPFAPGIVPPSSQYGQYPPPEPAPVQPAYFPMPAPPIVRVIVTPADEDRDVQTPSTITSMTNENSLGGLGLLHGLPPPSRTGSAASAASADPGRFDGGTFDPDLSTIHEHSREGTAFGGEEDFSNAGGVMTPDRSRNVEQWRRSLGLGGQPYSLAATQSPAVDPSNDLLRPPSSNSGSRRPRPQPLDLDRDRRLSSRSGSTSSRSININVEPPSHPTSPTPHDSRNRNFSVNQPQDDAFLSPHHAPLALSADPNDGPVIPTIMEEDEEDEEDGEDYEEDHENYYSDNSRNHFARDDFPGNEPPSMYPIPIVDSLPPGFVPTPNGTHIIQLQQRGPSGLSRQSHVASTGPVVSDVSGGVPLGFYANSSRRSIPNDYSRSVSSSSRTSSTTSSGLTSETELGRPSKYARSRRSKRSERSYTSSGNYSKRGLTSTFPPTMMDEEGMYGGGSGRYGFANGESAREELRAVYATTQGNTMGQGVNTLGGIHAIPGDVNAIQQPLKRSAWSNKDSRSSQYGSSQYGNVPAAATFGSSSRMGMPLPNLQNLQNASNVPMPEPAIPQYGVASMPEPSVPQFSGTQFSEPHYPQHQTYETRYSTPSVTYMPEPTVPVYPSATTNPGGRQQSLRRTKGTISGSVDSGAIPMPEPSVPQYPATNMTAATATTATQGYSPRYQTPGGGSRMTPAAMSMPEPTVQPIVPAVPAEYPTNVHQTPGGGSRMTVPVVSMPEPIVSQYGAPGYQGYQNQDQTTGGGSKITPAAIAMPEPGVSSVSTSQHLYGTPGSQYPNPNQTPGGGSRLTPAEVPMPEPSVPEYLATAVTRKAPRTTRGGVSRMTAPAMSMPEPSMSSSTRVTTLSSTDTPAGGTSRMTAPVVPMPEASVGSSTRTTAVGTGTPVGGTSRMTAPVVPMPEPFLSNTYSAQVHQTPAGATSRMTAPVIPMPEPSVKTSSVDPPMPGSFTPGGGSSGSQVTPAVVSMPEPTVPQYESVSSQGHPTPGGRSQSRMTLGQVTMPEPTVPQFETESAYTPRGTGNVLMPEPSVPQFGSSPAGASVSRITAPAVSMPEPTVPQVVPQENSDSNMTPIGGSRMIAPAITMPEPTVSSKPLSKAQKKKQKKKGGISMPEPEVLQYDDTAVAGSSSGITMPVPSVPSFDTPSGETSRMIPPTILMPEPSSNITAPSMNMPVPSVGTPSLSMGGVGLPQPSSPTTSGWGLGTPGGWGFGDASGPGTPNTNRRASLHAGTTPLATSQPLPVPNPIPGPTAALRKGRKLPGSIDSPASSLDSATMRNTEANKGAPRSARARGMTSAWGA